MNTVVIASQQELSDIGNGQYKLSVNVNWGGELSVLWMTLPENFIQFIKLDSYDWVLASLLIPAMKVGANLVVKGNVSPRLYLSATTDLQQILQTQNESLKSIELDVDNIIEPEISTSFLSGIGFSAGIDSLSSLAILEQHAVTKPSHLVTLNVGAMGTGEISQTMLQKYSNRVKIYADSFGYASLVMDSNLNDFYKDLSFESTHTIRTAAAILSLGNAFKNYYYSSGYTYEKIGVKPHHDMCISDPILLPLLSTENFQFHAIGTYLSRLEKVRLVCDFEASFNVLDVCVSEPTDRATNSKPNCTDCIKCRRQLVSLDLLGELDKFHAVFDLELYKTNRKETMYPLAMKALQGDSPPDADLIKLAQNTNKLKNFSFDKALKLAKTSWRIHNLVAQLIARDFSSKSKGQVDIIENKTEYITD